jgi:leader peptidase (prepilin peptidase)/N-methyltransferase
MTPGWVAAAILTGLTAGPFQRSVVFANAVPTGQPRRQCCPGCGHLVTHARSFRASIVWLTSRCPDCTSRFGLRPLVPESLTAVVLGVLATRASAVLPLAAACLATAVGVPLAFIDAAVRRLPDRLTMPLYAGVAALLAVTAAMDHQWSAFLRAVLAGAALLSFLLALNLLQAGIGLGDAKLALPVGTVLGWYGWPTLFTGAFLAFLGGGVYAIGRLALHRGPRTDKLPFGPFMISGAILAVIVAASAPP